MAKNGRRKGAGFERDVAKRFAEALGLEIRRTPMSGGWAQGMDDVAGDLVCIDPGPEAFPYCVECKNSEGWRLESLFTDQHKWFDDWWAQVLKACPEDVTPLVVFSRAYAPVFVSFPSMHLDMLASAIHPATEWTTPYFILATNGLHVVVMEMEVFISHLL